MLFHSKRKAVNYPNLLINNINIENVAEFNFLGIQLGQNLKWKTHQNHVSLKLTKIIGILNRLKHELPLPILKTIYNTLFLPHKDTTEEDLLDYLNANDIIPKSVHIISHEQARTKSFKICCDRENFIKCFNENVWPDSIEIRKYNPPARSACMIIRLTNSSYVY